MKWMRTRYVGAFSLPGGMIRHYVDAVRSDGFRLREGFETATDASDENVQNGLAERLNMCIEKHPLGIGAVYVSADGHMGEEGWTEQYGVN